MCILLLFISINLNFHRYNTAQLISPRAYKNPPFTRHRRSVVHVFVFPSITESAIPFHFLITDKVKKSSLLSTSPKVIPALFFDYGFPLDSSRFPFYIHPVSNTIHYEDKFFSVINVCLIPQIIYSFSLIITRK